MSLLKQRILIALLSSAGAFAQSYTISTIAGGAPAATPSTALSVSIGMVRRVATDPSGNVYFTAQNAVYSISSGVLSRIAGDIRADYTGDGGKASAALLNKPQGIAVDTGGNIYIADTGNNVIRLITNGVISTFAGNGSPGYSGDFGTPALAQLNGPVGVAMGKNGTVFIADSMNNVVRQVVSGTITTFSGNGRPFFTGDASTAASAQLNYPTDVAVDSAGNVFIADAGNNAIREVTVSNGNILTYAGRGTLTTGNGDGTAANAAVVSAPYAIAVDSTGNLYIAEYNTSRIRKVDTKGIITTIAGTGAGGFANDGGDPTKAQLSSPYGLAFDSSNNLYVADLWNFRVRKIAGSTITTVAGNGILSYSGDGSFALGAELNAPSGIAADAGGNIYFSDTANSRVRKLSVDSNITTVAGNGTFGFGGDGGAGPAAQLNAPSTIAVDSNGNVYIADTGNQRIREVGNGNISTMASSLNVPTGVAIDSAGAVYVTTYEDSRLRKILPNGSTVILAGDGYNGYNGDGGPAAQAELDSPAGVAVDAAGNVFIADSGNNVIRRIGTDGNISTVAGNGLPGYNGDGGPATSARLAWPSAIALDASGNIFIADGNRIRQVKTDGTIQTIAGSSFFGYTGDGGPALNARLNGPAGIAVDAAGNIYISDSRNNVIRKLTPSK